MVSFVSKYQPEYVYIVPLCSVPLLIRAFFDAKPGRARLAQPLKKTSTRIEKNAEGLVELIEKGVFKGKKIENILMQSLKPMLEKKIDFLVLGCTHYPLVYDTIKSLIPKNIEVLDSSNAVARQTKLLIEKNKINFGLNKAKYSFYCTGKTNSLKKILNNKFVITKVLNGKI